MATHTSTRRGILGAMAIAPVAFVVPATASATSPNFNAALAKFRAVDAAATDHDTGAYIRASNRCGDLQALIPHETVQWKANDYFAGEVWSTADKAHIKEARYFLDPTHKVPIRADEADYHQACLDLVAAVDRREAALEEARRKSGIYEAVDRSNELNDLRTDAMDEVVACPVHTAAELSLKIAFINEQGWWEYGTTHAAIAADVARLAA